MAVYTGLMKTVMGLTLDKIKTYAIVALLALLVILGAVFMYRSATNAASAAKAETAITALQADVIAKDTEITRMVGEVQLAKGVNEQNQNELKRIVASQESTVQRLTVMHKELTTSKREISNLRRHISGFTRPEDDGPLAPVLRSTIEQIDAMEHEVTQ
jgi:TolA-binding protein